MKFLLSILLIVSTIFTLGCDEEESTTSSIAVGADQLEQYLPYLEGKRVGLVVNPTSRLNTGVHLIDAMIEEQVNVTTLFAPEHGLRGEQDAGEEVEDGIDPETGLPVISLYGDHKKPTEEDLQNVDVLVFDMQDVGVRFYTYISTMQLVMEAAAEYGRQVVILDRPNPNGSYIAGPIMEPEHVSFVGMAPIPVVHGLTIAELALMINGELWLSNGVFLDEGDLKVVKVPEYSHSDSYSLPVAPSPNLQTDESVIHYPSLGLFESTTISVGRGTDTPFEVIGYPKEDLKINYEFQIADDSSAWPQQGEYVYGESYRIAPPENTKFSIEAFSRWYWAMRDLGYQDSAIVDRPEWLAQLIGTTEVLNQIRQGKPYQEIEASWQPELDAFSTLRETYRLYPD
ncbi:hypothetical protein CKF94_09290 [Vibrio coralliilyticus]|uniref:exo-beta-N-acetylmuramidase NamZ family protein n=1 Tax=Vibrio coralliilyticus TaxID=190893 RepID=UPI000BAB12FD|nr:DUF1343 domain-containing protein [Vibrio coralliilyticus]NOI57530.1 DUF1343 domain-containing protein [Vibrio coralliilyticus]PAT67616.1 hypothetical protein CKA27_12745 [Vibrio coralliilyticus]PAU38470.1 hypothetical protein CKF94_09290 [Vibrio coralliilyticus]